MESFSMPSHVRTSSVSLSLSSFPFLPSRLVSLSLLSLLSLSSASFCPMHSSKADSPVMASSSPSPSPSPSSLLPPPPLSTSPLSPPPRILMGPGPSTPHPRVLAAASLPLLGHMHPEFLSIMDDVSNWLKYSFQTTNNFTLAVSGSGHAAMEASVASVVEKGDEVLVGINGIWGERMTIMAARYGANVHRMETSPGSVFSLKEIEESLSKYPGTKILFLVHGESSTGTLQNLEGVGDLCETRGVLLFVDTVCTLGGIPLAVDRQKIDIVYSGSQKCLGAPVAPSPLSLSSKARTKLLNRKEPVQSYYLDMELVGEYWGVDGNPRKYHHTGMVSNVYSLREALALLATEGLEASWNRHLAAAQQLWKGLEDLGLEFFVPKPEDRLPTVTTVKVPAGVDWAAVPKFMMAKYSMEIAGGLGPTFGKVWRIGVMGHNARPATVALLLHALKDALNSVGYTPTTRKE